jgi:hypothetical protein
VGRDVVGDESVAELCVIAVGVDEVGVLEVAPADGNGEPGVAGLGPVAEDPAGQPHLGCGSAEDLVLLAAGLAIERRALKVLRKRP